MKKLFILILIITFTNCHYQTLKDVYNKHNNNLFLGVYININYGEEDHFLKLIGGDSLFIHTTLDSLERNGTFSYIYFTKGCRVTSVSHDTGGKFSKRITNTMQ